MDEIKAATSVKSLMNSIEIIKGREKSLDELVDLSNLLVEKFLNPRRQPEPDISEYLSKNEVKENAPILDVIDLLNDSADLIQRRIDVVSSNIQKVITLIG